MYIWPGWKNFCFFKSKSTTRWSKLKPWTLWTIDTHARVNGSWVLLIDRDALLDRNFCFTFFDPCPRVLPAEMACSLCLDTSLWMRKFNINLSNGILGNVIMSNLPNWPLIKRSGMFMLIVNFSTTLELKKLL